MVFVYILAVVIPFLVLLAFIRSIPDSNSNLTSIQNLKDAIVSYNTLAVLDFLQSSVGTYTKFTTRDVCEALNMEPAIAVGCLTALVYKGFIERVPEYQNGKTIKYLLLTEEGFNYDILEGK